MNKQKPTIGRIVHFNAPGGPYAAIVTGVHMASGVVDLVTFGAQNSIMFHNLVEHDALSEGHAGQWRWPPLAPTMPETKEAPVDNRNKITELEAEIVYRQEQFESADAMRRQNLDLALQLKREIGGLVLENSDLKAQLNKSIEQERGLTDVLIKTRRKAEEAVSLTEELLKQLGHAHKFIVGTPEHDAIVLLLEPTITRIRQILEPSQAGQIEAVAATVIKGLKS